MTTPPDAAPMVRALELAERGWGRVHPNPLVGAVVVRDGEVVGEGWHAEWGAAHAESMALAAAGERARGATMYVTLEPCVHMGKQPACVPAIIAAGIRRVNIAVADPDPVAAGGATQLAAAGLEVSVGMCADAASRLNVRFFRRHQPTRLPFVAVKLAVTMDGVIADRTGSSKWISGPDARAWVHRERAGFAAIGAGAATVIADDARLTVRGEVVPRIPPIRVVFDRSGALSPDHGIFRDSADVPLVIVLSPAAAVRAPEYQAAGADVVLAEDLKSSLAALMLRGIDALLVEGGGRLAGALLRGDLVHRIYQIQSPLWLGVGSPAWANLKPMTLEEASRWRVVERRALGDDTLLVLEP